MDGGRLIGREGGALRLIVQPGADDARLEAVRRARGIADLHIPGARVTPATPVKINPAGKTSALTGPMRSVSKWRAFNDLRWSRLIP